MNLQVASQYFVTLSHSLLSMGAKINAGTKQSGKQSKSSTETSAGQSVTGTGKPKAGTKRKVTTDAPLANTQVTIGCTSLCASAI